MNQPLSPVTNWLRIRNARIYLVIGLSCLWLFALASQAFAQDTSLAPLGTPSLYGNYCTTSGGVGLYPNEPSGSFNVNVPGTAVAAYWYWSGRSSSAPNDNDNTITIAVNGGTGQSITADQSNSSSVYRRFAWHTNIYQDVGLNLIQPTGTTNFTVSDLDINNDPSSDPEDHGVGVIVVYESPSCPFQKIDFTFGNDVLYYGWDSGFGPDSEPFCTSFDAATTARTLDLSMVVGGVADSARGNSIWYATGSGAIPTGDLTPDNLENANPNATEIIDPLNGSSGLEWDIYANNSISIAPGDTYACFQIESPADDEGISATWMGTAIGVPVEPPSIDIVKSPDTQTIISGATVTFTIQVQNTSSYTLTEVNVTDPQTPNCVADLGTLGPGEIAPAYTCTLDNVTDSFINQATVEGQPPFGGPVSDDDVAEVLVQAPTIDIVKAPEVQTISTGGSAQFTITVTNTGDVVLNNTIVTDALTSDCDRNLGTMAPGESQTYVCAAADVQAPFTNSATVVGQPPVGEPVEDTDTAEVLLANPSIDIQKTPDNQTIIAGSTVTFTITVTNTGDVTLDNVAVTDPLAPNCDQVLGTMAPQASESYTCTIADVTAGFTNIADVAGTAPDGAVVTDTDPAEVILVGPAIDIEKTPDNQTVRMGGTVTFTIQVANTGDVALTDVTVTDPQATQCNNSWPLLPVGAVESYMCEVENVQVDFVNTANVSGQPSVGPAVTDTDDAAVDVVLPLIEISKTPNTQVVLAGQEVNFSITVTNTGDTVLGGVDLFNVEVTDELTPQCNASLGTLNAGEAVTYQCTLPSAQTSFTNIAIATGTPSIGGEDVSDSDTADVIVIRPTIDIVKTPDLQTVVSGETVTFTIQVENTGSITLTNVTVTDPLSPSCDQALGTMAPGSVIQYDCSLSNVTADFTNVASVVGTPTLGPDSGPTADVTDTDDAAVDVIEPAISIIKSPDLQTVVAGGNVDFTITVQNTGDVPLFQVAVSDPVTPSCSRQIGDLTPGQSNSYQCTFNNVSADFVNVATVTGQPTVGAPVTDQDDAVVDLISPAITITKDVEEADIGPGDTAIFTIRVENTGDVVLTNVTVTDQIAPQCSSELGTLNPAEFRLYTCELPNVQQGLVNVADVVGTPPAGPNVTDQDDAEVRIPPADLHITKSDGGVETQPGGRIRYTLTYENRGQGDASDVIITEFVPENTTFNPAESDPNWDCADGSVAAGTSCTYNVGPLAAGASGAIDLIFTVDVSSQLPMSVGSIDNIVTIQGRNNVTVSGTTSANETTPLAPTALNEQAEPGRQLPPSIFIPLMSGVR